MNIRQAINARPDLVKYAVVAVVLFFGARYLMGDAARRAEAQAVTDRAEQSDVALKVALDSLAGVAAARALSEAEEVRLSAALDIARTLHGEITRQAADSIARLQERLKRLAVAREASASGFRAMLPEPLREPFDEHEAIHAAELAAAEFETEQVRRQLKASDVLVMKADSVNLGLRTLIVDLRKELASESRALALAITSRDLWKGSSENWRAVSERGLLGRIWQDAETYAVVVVTTVVAVKAFPSGN